jgi:hypothetical protein
VLPLLDNATMPLLVCQSFESFCYGENPQELFSEKPAIDNVIRLPISRIAISHSVQNILQKRLGVNAEYVPAAINIELFERESSNNNNRNSAGARRTGRRRVLFVGDYIWPLKGMADLIAALSRVNRNLPVELVVITSQTRERHCFDALPFPVETHTAPAQSELQTIYSSCDLYCCASWYEGFGLPALEAAAAGIPVVSTRTHGVSDYGVDGENVLLANINDADDLACKIELLLNDDQLADKLKQAAIRTAREYSWDTTVTACTSVLQRLHAQHMGQTDRLPNVSTSGSVTSSAELEALKRDLIQSGFYAQLSEQRKLTCLSREFEQLCGQLRSQLLPAAEAKSRLAAMKQSLADANASSDSSLQKQFKGRYDLCRVLLSLADQPSVVANVLAAGAPKQNKHELCTRVHRGAGDG